MVHQYGSHESCFGRLAALISQHEIFRHHLNSLLNERVSLNEFKIYNKFPRNVWLAFFDYCIALNVALCPSARMMDDGGSIGSR